MASGAPGKKIKGKKVVDVKETFKQSEHFAIGHSSYKSETFIP